MGQGNAGAAIAGGHRTSRPGLVGKWPGARSGLWSRPRCAGSGCSPAFRCWGWISRKRRSKKPARCRWPVVETYEAGDFLDPPGVKAGIFPRSGNTRVFVRSIPACVRITPPPRQGSCNRAEMFVGVFYLTPNAPDEDGCRPSLQCFRRGVGRIFFTMVRAHRCLGAAAGPSRSAKGASGSAVFRKLPHARVAG